MVEVTKRVYRDGLYRYEKEPQTFRTYAEAIRHYQGEQDWYDKLYHRFVKDGNLYLMEKK